MRAFPPPFRRPSLLLPAALVIACAPSSEQGANTADTAQPAVTVAPSVEILSPADGDTVSLPVTIRLSATGVEVVPATGAREEGKGHHHIVVDGDAPADTLPLPQPPVAIHLGDGSSERVLDALTPGPHRVIAIFAWGDHVPMAGVRRDTITFVVR